ncbi:MAG: ROK family protein [Erysipelotrichaceae bacterium]|jgi:glucokinase|nr:ROK family protein [Erysipelotrichaceae bacterium]
MSHVIAFDIGGTNTRVALFNADYQPVSIIKIPTVNTSKEAFIQSINDLTVKLIALVPEIKCVVLGVAGRVRLDGFIEELPNLFLSNIDFVKNFRDEFNLTAYVLNDAVVAGYAEALIGEGKDFDRVYFITISTGVGGALFMHQNFIPSSDEIGHTLFKYQDTFYEFEKIASGRGLVTLAKLNQLDLSTAKDFFNEVRSGNLLAVRVFEDWISLFREFLDFISYAFRPDIVVLTGGVLHNKDLFFPRLTNDSKLRIVPSVLFDDAGLYGAAAYGFKE